MSRWITYCLIALLCTTNCVEPYDFTSNESKNYLVVDGRIDQEDQINRVRKLRSTEYGTAFNDRPVENAMVTLVDSNGDREQLLYEENGYYIHYGFELDVVIGRSYHIEIELNGDTYRSDPQIVPEPVQPDSLSFQVGYSTIINSIGNPIVYESIELFINTPINQNDEKTYLRWKVDESWSFTERRCSPLSAPKTCYRSGGLEPDRIFVFSSEDITGTYLSRHLIAEKLILDRVEFLELHYFRASQYTMSRETYEYWDKTIQIANPSGDIFDLPPAPLAGNVYNVNNRNEIVLGYFEVLGKATALLPIRQADILPIRVTNKNFICSRPDYRRACCNCLLLSNSDVVRPDYWN